MTKKFIIGCLFLYILSICIEYYPKAKEYYHKGKVYNEGNYCSISDKINFPLSNASNTAVEDYSLAIDIYSVCNVILLLILLFFIVAFFLGEFDNFIEKYCDPVFDKIIKLLNQLVNR